MEKRIKNLIAFKKKQLKENKVLLKKDIKNGNLAVIVNTTIEIEIIKGQLSILTDLLGY